MCAARRGRARGGAGRVTLTRPATASTATSRAIRIRVRDELWDMRVRPLDGEDRGAGERLGDVNPTDPHMAKRSHHHESSGSSRT